MWGSCHVISLWLDNNVMLDAENGDSRCWFFGIATWSWTMCHHGPSNQRVPSKQTKLISSTSCVRKIPQKHTSLWENTEKNKHLWHKLHLFYPFTIQRFQHLLRHPKKPTWPTVSSSATTPEISRPGSRYLRKPMMKASLFTKAVFLGGGGGTWVGWIFLGRIHRIFAIGTCGGLHA